jgi:ubiquinone/menaquinone biosynthesis C-methylase UbiE
MSEGDAVPERRGHAHGAEHGHAHDRGVGGFLRYLRLLPHMWRSQVGREVVASIAPRAGERVVDLGAGMGSATVVAARSGASVLAVDPTPYMRRILSVRRGWQRHRARITVVDGAAESIPVADASVDALWTVNTIHHWTDAAAACREIARVIRPRGRVLLVDEDFDDPSHPDHERAQAGRARHGLHFEHVDPEKLAESLRGAGFAAAEGVRTSVADRPAKVVRATR